MQVAQLGNASGTLHRKIPLHAAARQARPGSESLSARSRARAEWRLADAHRGRERAQRRWQLARAPTRALPGCGIQGWRDPHAADGSRSGGQLPRESRLGALLPAGEPGIAAAAACPRPLLRLPTPGVARRGGRSGSRVARRRRVWRAAARRDPAVAPACLPRHALGNHLVRKPAGPLQAPVAAPAHHATTEVEVVAVAAAPVAFQEPNLAPVLEPGLPPASGVIDDDVICPEELVDPVRWDESRVGRAPSTGSHLAPQPVPRGDHGLNGILDLAPPSLSPSAV